MIRKPILELLHQGAHMQRWNDHIRPKGFTELDKQAQKMVIAYVVAKFEEKERNTTIDWRELIEGGLFEYLQRVILTDIKPPIYYQLMEEQGQALNKWVVEQLKDNLENVEGDFFLKFKNYLFDDQYSCVVKKILKAAHHLSTYWEFKIIYSLNANIFGIEETKTRIENEMEEHYELIGVQKLTLNRKTSNFLDLVGQLRFQQRWAQSPRLPETSVMGHMLIVAMLSYFCSLELKACDRRLCNNYFAALFHDLPEVLTRDIISPVKASITGLDKLIKEIENRQITEKIFPLLPLYMHEEINYFLQNEFASKIKENGKIHIVTPQEINKKYNSKKYSPIDGEVLKGCDNLAAFIEATLSISHGITSNHLREGANSLYQKYKNKNIAGIEFGQIFDYFKQ